MGCDENSVASSTLSPPSNRAPAVRSLPWSLFRCIFFHRTPELGIAELDSREGVGPPAELPLFEFADVGCKGSAGVRDKALVIGGHLPFAISYDVEEGSSDIPWTSADLRSRSFILFPMGVVPLPSAP
jgi:hypothetical protein